MHEREDAVSLCGWRRRDALLLLSVFLNIFFVLRWNSGAGLIGQNFGAGSDVPWRGAETASLQRVGEDIPRTSQGTDASRSTAEDTWGSLVEANSRALSSTSSGSTCDCQTSSGMTHGLGGMNSGSSHASGHDGPHDYDAMVFLFNALVIGTAVMHLSTYYWRMQETVVLFVLGMLFALTLEGLKVVDDVGVFGQSYAMWMEINPHLLLFTMLPALLAGDAMSIDTSVAKRVAHQCLYLAGPGVLINALAIAVFLAGYLGWNDTREDLLLCLVTGSILCATDPVAVVALLKELGASPILTVQIQGESLLNDGTAIVLYTIAYNMLRGEKYDSIDVLMFLIQTAVMAWALGMFIGYFFFTWIRLADDKLKHSSSMIQISLTLCCAYWSFIMAEGVLHISGVLATVSSSLVLAHHMWPHIVCQDSLHHVWHTFESLGNMLIFFLAGALTGSVMVEIPMVNWLHLVVIWFALLLVRGSFIFASRPVLRYLSVGNEPVKWQDATVMTWGGLRGAVGLMMAIQVHNERAPNDDGELQISTEKGRLVLFFVSGIAFLTTVVNATTAPALVHKLGITALPKAHQKLLKMLHAQLVSWSVNNSLPDNVCVGLRTMLSEIDHHISSHKVQDDELANLDNSNSIELGEGRKSGRGRHQKLGELGRRSRSSTTLTPAEDDCAEDIADILSTYHDLRHSFEKLGESTLKVLGELPQPNFMGNMEDIISLLNSCVEKQNGQVDVGMSKVVNKVFMSLVSNNYWRQIDQGLLRAGSQEADVLLTSIRMSLSPLRCDLMDFKYVSNHVRTFLALSDSWWKALPEESSSQVIESDRTISEPTRAQILVRSGAFNGCICVLIILNGIYVAVEEASQNSGIEDHTAWLVIEALFTTVFIAECVLKIMAQRFSYFMDNWNRFDLLLVLLAIFGVTLSAQVQSQGNMSSEARLLRISRVFRILRFLRVVRLFHAKLNLDKTISVEVADRMHRITVLVCFIRAHLIAETEMVRYFGSNNKIDDVEECEIARCVLQSHVSVYKALIMARAEEQEMDAHLIEELMWCREKKNITEGLEKFVMSAYKDGAINAREAESILHPLHKQIAKCLQTIHHTTQGLLVKNKTKQTLHTSRSSMTLTLSSSTVSPGSPQDRLREVSQMSQMDEIKSEDSTPRHDKSDLRKSAAAS